MAEPLRHRQTKEAATDMFSLPPPRHIPTLPITARAQTVIEANTACAAATGAAISAKWAVQQAWAARDALRNFAGNLMLSGGPAAAAASANAGAAEAALTA